MTFVPGKKFLAGLCLPARMIFYPFGFLPVYLTARMNPGQVPCRNER